MGQIIYTSFARAGEPGQPHPLIVNHRETERMLAESGLMAVAAAVLASGGSEGQLIEVTGPAAVTEAEAAAALGVRHESVDDTEAAEWLTKQGLPDALVQGWLSTSHLKREGWYDVVTHAVERLAGRKPTSIEAFFADPNLRGWPQARAARFEHPSFRATRAGSRRGCVWQAGG